MEQGRRTFIKRALYGLLALFGIGSLVAGLRIFAPSGRRDKELAWFPLVSEDEIPRSGVRRAELAYAVAGEERKARVFIVSSQDSISVLSAICSHLGCLVNYRKETREFVCPCHGGRYDIAGRNIAGPPPAPLTAYPVQVKNGMVLVGVKV
jgi:Rieske Fe-S protein